MIYNLHRGKPLRLPIIELSAPHPGGFETGPRSIAAVRVLRISLTDRCNYRCVYCMPEEGVPWLPKDDLLTLEQIRSVARAAMKFHGITRFKLTGGEPTLRPDLVDIVAMLRAEGAEDISLTTNGQRLEPLLKPLRQAGLDRITVSVDTLQPEKFRKITRTGDLSVVLRAIAAAQAEKFRCVKINCVTMRGVNDNEFTDFARLTMNQRITVRFIEYMPLGDAALQHSAEEALRPVGPAGGCDSQNRGDALIPEAEVRQSIEKQLGPLIPLDRSSESGVGPASVWKLAAGEPLGRIGFISAMSAPFCATCNRLRLTADGLLRSCLFDGGEVDLKPIFNVPTSGDATDLYPRLAHAMTECVRLKPDVHSRHGNQQMNRIGG
jgi:GTP 3',8-cyclase